MSEQQSAPDDERQEAESPAETEQDLETEQSPGADGDGGEAQPDAEPETGRRPDFIAEQQEDAQEDS